MYIKRLICLLFITVISMLLSCNIFEPQEKSGGLVINPVFPQPEGEGLHKTQASIDRAHVTVTNSGGAMVVNEYLSDSGSYLEGTFKVDAGTYSAQIYCYKDSLWVYTGSRTGISVQAGGKTIVDITLTGTTVAIPAFSPAPGTYTSAQSVEIFCSTPGADIYYTTNGVDPTTSSTQYSGAITIISTTTLKARAYKSGWTTSGVQSGTYTINSGSNTGTVTDIDGNVYQTVKIGNQWWMAEDLRVTHYRNGDAIPNVTSNSQWTNLTTGAYCYYDNNSNYASTYGALYNWYAVNDSCNIAPAGWHVPTDAEWKQLEMYLGMSQSAANDTGWRGTDEGGKLKETGTSHWNSPNEGATNAGGFTARPGGYRISSSGSFGSMGYYANYWSATETNNDYAWYRHLGYYGSDVYRYGYGKHYGFSVRLVRDN